MKTIIVDSESVRLDRYIRRHFPNLKQSILERSLRKGLIKVNGCKVQSSSRVSYGEAITIQYLDCIYRVNDSSKSDKKLLELLRNNILYKDKYLLAINKPAGITVQGGKKVIISISDLLDQIIEKETLKIVHRLDKDTSGVIVFARSTEVAKHLMQEFKERRVKKVYLALTSGTPSKKIGVIDRSLIKKYIFGQEKVVVDKNSSRPAITHFSLIEKLKHDIAYLKLSPITGRTHQLRAHLASINCPILSDGKYGGKKAFVEGISKQIHLHSTSLSFNLPNGQNLTIVAPISQHIEQSLKILNYSNLEAL
ncbi:RluA family pseudouridine synthase [Wolbachia endosymbiont of Pentidionis agamae]|uniref:RluA family pseudouridine synthase n=1 Tax=Wolbachia endosymbiont of Pentidionis agamae TaxID=3110435 RepID=UPI002FD401F3